MPSKEGLLYIVKWYNFFHWLNLIYTFGDWLQGILELLTVTVKGKWQQKFLWSHLKDSKTIYRSLSHNFNISYIS